ncbi:hypothetical protein CKO28_18335 [Rhodovibrio sodomensis]|uniref:Uncharacterized protein n=1 Tax=Rhodovibrio sodomensis TaxID=1088 RepID=A0ABS1DJ17_9PROT|nr:hypothetical protein [Rhodovibrio sodomensis]MBK1669996.1 hypothetical protein [Rhodovibrio sodomensis]
MNLGTVLQNLQREPDPVTLLGEDIDLVTLARASAAAGARGERLSQYLQESVAAFLDHASEEEWAQLIGRLRDGDCGAGTCLNLMLKRRLRQEGGHACACG